MIYWTFINQIGQVGLLGSQDIANQYAEQQKRVAGYLNFDMDGKSNYNRS